MGFDQKVVIKKFEGANDLHWVGDKNLARYDDERSIDAIVEMLEDSENYIFYYDIIAMMDEFGGYEKFKNRIRKVSYKAMIKQRRAGN